MFKEDNTGFINFPIPDSYISVNDEGCTLIYIVAFETEVDKETTKLGNASITLPGLFISDDVMSRPRVKVDDTTLDTLIESHMQQNEYDAFYFPNLAKEVGKQLSVDMISVICVGWCNHVFEFKDAFWNASFKDLTYEGRNLYYGIKKLHNLKEVRILTFTTKH